MSRGIITAALLVGCDAAQALGQDCPRILIFNQGAEWPHEDQDRTIAAAGFRPVQLPDEDEGHLCPVHAAAWDALVDEKLGAGQ